MNILYSLEVRGEIILGNYSTDIHYTVRLYVFVQKGSKTSRHKHMCLIIVFTTSIKFISKINTI
jgi:hypothetical protein